MSMDKRKKIIFLLATGAVTLVAFCAVFILDGFFPFGNGSTIALDLHSQYTPLLYRFYDIVTGSKGVAVDFHIAGGMNIFADSATELLNPVNYLLLLFGRENIYLAVNIMLMVYGLLASMSAFGVLDYLFPSKKYLNMVLSVSYALSFFAAYQFEIIRWMFPMALFPLIFLSLLWLLHKKKPVLFIILIAYQLMLSLQLGIQTLGFSLVISIFYLYKEKKNNQSTGYKSFILIISVILAVLISAIVLIPEIINLMSSSRSLENSVITNIVTSHGFDDILERILEVISPVVLGLFVVLFIRLKGKRKDVYRENRFMFYPLFLLLITVLFEPSNLIWHLGSYKCFPVRFGYMVLFYSIYLLRFLFEKVPSENEKTEIKKIKIGKLVLSLLAVVLSITVLGFAYVNRLDFSQAFATLAISYLCIKETMWFCGMMILLSAAVVLCAVNTHFEKKGLSRYILILITMISGMVMYISVLFPQTSLARTYDEKAYEVMNESPNAGDSKADSFTIHVRDNNKLPLNAALVTNEYSMTAYIPSGEGKKYSEGMKDLSYATPWISVRSNGGSTLSDMVLAIDNGNIYKPVNMGILISDSNYEQLKQGSGYMALSKALSAEYLGKVIDVEKSDKLNELNEAVYERNQGRQIIFDNRHQTVQIVSENPMYGNLLLPMGYIDGWNSDSGQVGAYLKGFIALEGLNGETTVTLNYNLPGKNTGIVISVAGVILLILLIFLLRKGKPAEGEYKPWAIAFRAVAAAFIIVVYILANLMMFIYMGFKFFGKDLKPLLESASVEETGSVLLDATVEDEGITVILGKNSLSSEIEDILADSVENPEFDPSKAIDHDAKTPNSRWSSANDWENADHFLQAEFNDTTTVSALKIYWERTNASNYAIEISDDGESWTEVTAFDSPSLNKEQTIIFDSPVSGKYIRIHVKDVERKEEDLSLYYQNVSIREWEIFKDSELFVIKKPELTSGYMREIPIPEVPLEYELSFGGINYEDLLNEDTFADTISEVLINLGYILTVDDKEYELPGFDLVLPASDGSEKEQFPYKDTVVREWKRSIGEINIENASFKIFSQIDDFEEEKSLFENEIKEIIPLKDLSDESDNEITVELMEESISGNRDSELYEIMVDPSGSIIVRAETYRGLRRAEITLEKMLIENPKAIPCGTIRDYPEYEVRGFSIDLGRRPVSVDFLKTVIDEMSRNNMNSLQLHLNDNAIISESEFDGTVEGARNLYSAFRLESKLGISAEDFIYTNEEIRELIHYGKLRGIEIVPEIDTPAHSLALTSKYPNLGFSNDPNMVDTLDVGRTEAVNTVIDIWSEYLTKGDAETSLFEETGTVHLGMDEYYGDFGDYHDYIITLSRAIKDMSPAKKLRMWGSLTYKDMELSDLPKDIEVMIWSTVWAEPDKLFDEGFGLINCLNNNLYIIVGGGFDRLNTEYLSKSWEPNVYETEEKTIVLPKWSPKVLGACYSLWNDNYTKGIDNSTEEDLLGRIEEPMKIIADKLW